MTIDEYISRIDGFLSLKPSEQIPYFCYFLITYQSKGVVSVKDIKECFEILHLPQYSNISAYLSREKKCKRLVSCNGGGYALSKCIETEISRRIGDIKVNEPSNNFFPIELLDNTRSYLRNTARQVILCYDYQLYDACLVMVRRLLETLIIELFERHDIREQIQDSKGNYFFCADLIDQLLKEKKLWTIGRNAKSALPAIKAKGDLSAHNRRFNAKKADIDMIKDGIRIVIEELVHLINYEQWHKENK